MFENIAVSRVLGRLREHCTIAFRCGTGLFGSSGFGFHFHRGSALRSVLGVVRRIIKKFDRRLGKGVYCVGPRAGGWGSLVC